MGLMNVWLTSSSHLILPSPFSPTLSPNLLPSALNSQISHSLYFNYKEFDEQKCTHKCKSFMLEYIYNWVFDDMVFKSAAHAHKTFTRRFFFFFLPPPLPPSAQFPTHHSTHLISLLLAERQAAPSLLD